MSAWQPIESAPRDGRCILAKMSQIDDDRWSYLSGRYFVIRHEGKSARLGFDLGWSLFPGLGSALDKWIAWWMPLPATMEGRS